MNKAKTNKNIGLLQGKVLVFGGVYSNLQALEKLMKIAADLDISPSNIICTGDIVGYCAQPETCVQMVKNWGIHSISGNVEIQLSEGKEDCGCDFTAGSRCNTFSQQWYPFAQSKLSPSSIEWMQSLPEFIQFQYAQHKGIVLHGSYHKTAEFIFKSTPWPIKEKNFVDTDSSLILAGHCGLPFHQQKENKYWLNAGVIGMPANDGTPQVWYMLMDTNENGEFVYSHHSFNYDYKQAAQLMKDHQLTPQYALTLQTGVWDNMDILPDEEIDWFTKMRSSKKLDH